MRTHTQMLHIYTYLHIHLYIYFIIFKIHKTAMPFISINIEGLLYILFKGLDEDNLIELVNVETVNSIGCFSFYLPRETFLNR